MIVKLPGDTSLPLAQGSSPTQALVVNDRPYIYNVNFSSAGRCRLSSSSNLNGELRANAEQPLPASEFGSAPVFGLELLGRPRVARQLCIGAPTASKVGVLYLERSGRSRVRAGRAELTARWSVGSAPIVTALASTPIMESKGSNRPRRSTTRAIPRILSRSRPRPCAGLARCSRSRSSRADNSSMR